MMNNFAYWCKECTKLYGREYRKDKNNKKKIKQHRMNKKEKNSRIEKEYREELVDSLKDKIRETKTIKFLLDNAEIVEKE